jgi:hypothetical protein
VVIYKIEKSKKQKMEHRKFVLNYTNGKIEFDIRYHRWLRKIPGSKCKAP